MKKTIAFLCLMLATPALGQAQPPSALNQGAVTLDKFNHEVEDSVMGMLQAHSRGDRTIHHDVAYPGSPGELKAMHGFALLLVSAWAQSPTDLPLKGVYLLNKSGKSLLLPLVGSVARPVPSGALVGKVYGFNRRDSFYLLPLDVVGKDVSLAADFPAKDGFIIEHEVTPPDYGTIVHTDSLPPRAAVQAMMDREYPGFGIPIDASFK